MGKASSTKKVARAAKLGGTPKAKSYEPRSLLFPISIGIVFVLGIFLVLYARSENRAALDTSVPYWKSTIASQKHIHNAYGIYICDHFAEPLADGPTDLHGIHTHKDGLMHIHPFDSSVSGRSAKLKVFGQQVGLKVSKTSIEFPGEKKKNGDECPASADGKIKAGKGEMQYWIYATPTAEKPDRYTGDPAGIHFQADETLVMAFVVPGTEITKPKSMASLTNPNAAEGGSPAPSKGTTTSSLVQVTAPGATTTIPSASGSSTTAPGASTTTSASSTTAAASTTKAP